MTWKVDVQLSQSVIGAADRARELEAMGVDGVFTFENSHDLFFPLVAAAPVCDLDLMTNVAIAFPRSPHHLANAAYDLQQQGLAQRGRQRMQRVLQLERFRAGAETLVDAAVEIVIVGKGRPFSIVKTGVLVPKNRVEPGLSSVLVP